MADELVFGVFRVGDLEVGIPAAILQEVIDWPDRIVPGVLSPDYVLGTLDLRGKAIPTLDLRRLMRISGDLSSGRIVILRTTRGRFGLAIDNIADVISISPEELHQLKAGAPDEEPIVASIILSRGRIIQVLDIDILAAQSGVVLLSDQAQAIRTGAANDFRKQYLFFDCDELRFCLEATSVREVIDQPQLDRSGPMSDMYRGLLRLRGEAIPVLDLFNILALDGRARLKSKLLVLDLAERVIAILVSDVITIQRLSIERIMPLPGYGLRRPDMFDGVVSCEDGGKDTLMLREDAILLSHDAISRDPELMALRRLHDGLDEHEEHGLGRCARGPRSAFLGYEAGASLTTALAQVEEIMEMPAQYVRLPSPDGVMLGLLKRRGKMVPLVDLRSLNGQPGRMPDKNSRVLVVAAGTSRFAFIIDGTKEVQHVYVRKELEVTAAIAGTLADDLRSSTRLLLVEGVHGERTKQVLDLVALAHQLRSRAGISDSGFGFF